MKKQFLILASAAVILSVVLTAGCIGEQPQIYASSDDMFIFYSNGTGTYSAGTDDESFDWSEENSTRMILFADGDVLTVDINKARGLMTTSEGTVYELKPNAVSGAVNPEIEDVVPVIVTR